VVKVALGEGSDPPTRVSTVTLNTGDRNFNSAVIDAANGYQPVDKVLFLRLSCGEGLGVF